MAAGEILPVAPALGFVRRLVACMSRQRSFIRETLDSFITSWFMHSAWSGQRTHRGNSLPQGPSLQRGLHWAVDSENARHLTPLYPPPPPPPFLTIFCLARDGYSFTGIATLSIENGSQYLKARTQTSGIGVSLGPWHATRADWNVVLTFRDAKGTTDREFENCVRRSSPIN